MKLESFARGQWVSPGHELAEMRSAVNGDVTFGEWYMDITFKNGFRAKIAQVAVRRWKDGKLVHERFYYHK